MPSPILKHFENKHLVDRIREVCKPIAEAAKIIDETMPDSAEKTTCLRKLLEATDCLVRVAIDTHQSGESK